MQSTVVIIPATPAVSFAKVPASVTFMNLEFGTGEQEAMPLGDIASSLVTVDELLRDLASIAAYPSNAEFRNIEVVAIEMRKPLKVKLSLLAISAEAVSVFLEICREVIAARKRSDGISDERLAGIKAAVELLGGQAHINQDEAQRIFGHIVTLQNAEVPLKRVEVTAATS